MAATKSTRENEGLKDRRRRERQNQILRHARQSARAIRKRDEPSSSLAPTPGSLKSLSNIRVKFPKLLINIFRQLSIMNIVRGVFIVFSMRMEAWTKKDGVTQIVIRHYAPSS